MSETNISEIIWGSVCVVLLLVLLKGCQIDKQHELLRANCPGLQATK